MCCPVGVSEEFIAVFLMEMSHIDTENDKNLTFPIFQCIFVPVSTDFVDWNVLKGQQRKD